MSDFIVAIGLVLVIEGVMYALFPAGMRRMLATALVASPAHLRVAGLVATILGVGLVWLVKR